MSKKISTIGYEIPGLNNLKLGFSSKSSLMDSDILLVAPDLPYYERSFSGDGYYLGKVCYGENGSFKLKADLAHWKKEIINSLNAGKTVFLMLSEKNDFFVDTGSRSYSGSGRNRNTTINVAPSSNYELIPAGIGNIHSANGKEILFVGNPLFSNFFKSFKPNLEYKIYLEDIGNATPIFTGKDKTKILGAIYKVGAGQLVVLPYLNYDEEKFTEYKKNKKGEKEAYWTKDAIKFGHMLTDYLIEIDKGLLQDLSKTPPPLWVLHEKYSSKKEVNIQKNINANIEKIKKIENDNKRLQSELLEEQGLKDLLYEQGKPLENAVIKALKIFGFEAKNYDDGKLELDQVITSPEGYRYIGECEGKNEKDVDIAKFRQLLESLNADFAREEVQEKAFGILFGNAQRLIDPEKRTLDFTQKCKIGADREKIALVKTADLFNVAQFLKENKDDKFQKECRTAIHNGLGKIVVFPSVPTDSQNKNDSK